MSKSICLRKTEVLRLLSHGECLVVRQCRKHFRPHHWSMLPGYEFRTKVVPVSNGLALRVSHVFRGEEDGVQWFSCPFGPVGSRLVGKETWRTLRKYDDLPGRVLGQYPDVRATIPVQYEVDGVSPNWPKHPTSPLGVLRRSSTLPPELSRLPLTTVSVECRRVQTITEEEALQAGVTPDSEQVLYADGTPSRTYEEISAAEVFAKEWDRYNPRHQWSENPHVWLTVVKVTKE